ncbi:MAG: putative Importin subunit alpha-4 [Streblomastix strix]|uniref:Importin subunit alpha n=1 Tax=Streblomastix strix TaxID=222440 RepID=A0A5J4X982_9EUKA|nr:MAG: putative Importin subunit alpha-4 [Streblomastix strix]
MFTQLTPQQRSALRFQEFQQDSDPDAMRHRREAETEDFRRNRRDTLLQRRRRATNTDVIETQPQVNQGEYVITQEEKDTIDELLPLVQNLQSENKEIVLENTIKIRKLLSTRNHPPPVQGLTSIDIVTSLVKNLDDDSNTKIQFETEWCLTNIASGSTANARAVAFSGGIEKIIALGYSLDQDVRHQAVWCLGNLAGDSIDLRKYMLQVGALEMAIKHVDPSLVDENQQRPNSQQEIIAWAICNFVKNLPNEERCYQAVLPLCSLLQGKNEGLIREVTHALSILTEVGIEPQQEVVKSGQLRYLIQFGSGKEQKIACSVIKIIGNLISCDDDSVTQAVLDSGGLNMLLSNLKNTNGTIERETIWALSNLAAGTQEQVDYMVRQGVAQAMMENLQTRPCESKREICWLLMNLSCSDKPFIINSLVEARVLQELPIMLRIEDTGMRINILNTILNILRFIMSNNEESKARLKEYQDQVNQDQASDNSFNDQFLINSTDEIKQWVGACVNDICEQYGDREIKKLLTNQAKRITRRAKLIYNQFILPFVSQSEEVQESGPLITDSLGGSTDSSSSLPFHQGATSAPDNIWG